jgi:hypothetical protein
MTDERLSTCNQISYGKHCAGSMNPAGTSSSEWKRTGFQSSRKMFKHTFPSISRFGW